MGDYNYLVFRNVNSEGTSSLISRILYNETLVNICASRQGARGLHGVYVLIR